MPQTLDQLKNPWGAQSGLGVAALEAQRSDLFTLDLSIPLGAIRNVLQRSESQTAQAMLAALPDQARLPYFATAVELPEARVGVYSTKRHEIHVPWPGAEEPQNALTVTFIQDASQADDPRSGILALLRAWRAIVRAGRPGQAPGELSLDLLSASREGRSLIPDFRHNFTVYLWRGRIPSLSSPVFSDAQTAAAAGVEMCGQWTVTRAWLSGFQPGPLRMAQSGIQEIRATFQPQAVVEESLPTGTVLLGVPTTVA